MARIPVAFDATYVGRREASEFTPRDRPGEKIAVPARLKFLHQRDGDAELVEISGSQLDRVEPPVDYAGLGVGEQVHVEGIAVIPDRGSDRDAYVQITRFEVA